MHRASALQEQVEELSKVGDSAIKSSCGDVINQLQETFGATDPEQVLGKVIEMQETSRLVEDELQKMQSALQAKQAEIEESRTENEAKLAQLETQLRQATAVQKAPEEAPPAQPAMSNFTRNLLQNKDNEIDKQKTQIISLEDRLWNVEQELKLASGKLA